MTLLIKARQNRLKALRARDGKPHHALRPDARPLYLRRAPAA